MFYVCLSQEGIENALNQLNGHQYAELRIDLVKPSTSQLVEILSNNDISFIATCRPNVFDEETSINMLEIAAKNGADYVDIEIERGQQIAQRIKNACKNTSCKMIVSYHNYECTPSNEELHKIVNQAISYGADCIKIACKVNFETDNARLLALYDLDENIVAFGMGQLGKITRVASLFCGAPFTYAAANEGKSTAPGQFTLSEIQKTYQLFK